MWLIELCPLCAMIFQKCLRLQAVRGVWYECESTLGKTNPLFSRVFRWAAGPVRHTCLYRFSMGALEYRELLFPVIYLKCLFTASLYFIIRKNVRKLLFLIINVQVSWTAWAVMYWFSWKVLQIPLKGDKSYGCAHWRNRHMYMFTKFHRQCRTSGPLKFCVWIPGQKLPCEEIPAVFSWQPRFSIRSFPV